MSRHDFKKKLLHSDSSIDAKEVKRNAISVTNVTNSVTNEFIRMSQYSVIHIFVNQVAPICYVYGMLPFLIFIWLEMSELKFRAS